MLVVEIVAAINAAGTLQTLYLSDEGFCTSPTDTPANTFCDPRIIDPGSLGLHAFGDGRTSGTTRLESGDLVLVNTDGALDDWINYSFDGRSITIRSGEEGGAYPSSFTTVFKGTMESFETTFDKAVIKLRDKQFVFDLPLLTTLYTGSNVLPDGLEGTPDDIKDTQKPRVYGKVYNITPAFINTSKLTYQVSDGPVQSISAVYDKGAAFTAGADFATTTLLQAAVPAAGSYVTCLSAGMFRLGSKPAGTVTADVTQGATAADRTVAQIVKAVALAASLSAGEISAADVTALDTLNSSVVGVYVSDDSTFQSVIDQLVNSVGAYASFDNTGTLRMGRLASPSGTPLLYLQEYDIRDNFERRSIKDGGIPVYRVSVNYSKIYTPQSSDLAGVVTEARRAAIAKEWSVSKVEDIAIKTQWKLSDELKQDTLLTNATDAATEAARLLALYKVRRDLYEVTISSSLFAQANLKIMDVVSVTSSRFGMSGGKLFKVLGYSFSLRSQEVTLNLWA